MAAPAAPSLSLVVDAGLEVVEATVGVPAGATRLYLERLVDGVPSYVRGAQGATVTPSSSVEVVDYEAPLEVELTYRAAVENDLAERSTPTSAGPVTIDVDALGDPWLVDLVDPTNTQRVVLERLAELTLAVPAGVHYVIGRRAPIVTSDVAKAPTFELAFVTLDLEGRDRARATLATGYPVLLRTPVAQGVGDLYLAVLGYTEQRPSRLAQAPERRFLVRGQETDAPA